MTQWLRNGGPLALAAFGLAIAGFTSGVIGWTLFAIGAGAFVAVQVWERVPSTVARRRNAEADRVLTTLGAREIQIIQLRHGAEAEYAADPESVPGRFSVFLGEGRYGSMRMAEARDAFDSLQRHGVTAAAGQEDQTVYSRWTELGRVVRRKLCKESATRFE